MDDLTHEIRLLRLLVVASILFSLSLGGALIWLMATRNSADHLTVHRLDIVDNQAKERLRLYIDASDDPHIELLDKDGKVTRFANGQ
jgi:hypothetical protein